MLWYVNKYLNVFLFLSHSVIFVVMNLTYPFTRVISCMKKHSNIVNHLTGLFPIHIVSQLLIWSYRAF